MNKLVERLRSVLEHVAEGNPAVAQCDVSACLSPRAAWLLITLVRKLRRRIWAREVIEDRLQIAVPSYDGAGILTSGFKIDDGTIPGLSGWTYEVNRFDVTLTDRVSNESIRWSVIASDWRTIDVVGFANGIHKRREPEFPEARLKALHAYTESFQPTFGELRDFAVVAGYHRTFYLLDCVLELQDVVAKLDNRWSDETFCEQVARAVGDWLYLEGKVGALEGRQVAAAADSVRFTRSRRLSHDRQFGSAEEFAGNFYAMWECNSAELHDWLKRRLREDTYEGSAADTDLCSAAAVIDALQDGELLDELHRALSRSWSGFANATGWQHSAVKVLLKHSRFQNELLGLILSDAPSDQSALIALQHRPEEARRLFAAALRSRDADVRFQAAAALAILDEPWSGEVLVAALHADDDEMTFPVRAALRKSRNHALHGEADRWEADHLGRLEEPDCLEGGPLDCATLQLGITVEELLSLRGRVQSQTAGNAQLENMRND